MGGRIDCPSCEDYLTPEEVTVGESLGCTGCAADDDRTPSDGGVKERVREKIRAHRAALLFGALVPTPA